MLTERQKEIFNAVIKEYTRSAIPVGSVHLLKKYRFDVSPATMRSELAKLEDKGYLYQPHTSSGRIPTDKGYQYFVEELMHTRELSHREQVLIQKELLSLKAKHQRLARTTAKLLGLLSNNLAISGLIEEEEYFPSGMKGLLSQPDFSNLDTVCQIAEALDFLDQGVDKILDSLEEGEIKTLIGKENPLLQNPDCSLVVSHYKDARGKHGLVAIMGPKRMRYEKNISLVRFVTDLLQQ